MAYSFLSGAIWDFALRQVLDQGTAGARLIAFDLGLKMATYDIPRGTWDGAALIK